MIALAFRPPPAGLTAIARAWRPRRRRRAMVSEDDAYALVADVMMLRAARGHDVTVTPENTVWLMRAAGFMLGAFGGRETAEENDD